MLQRRIVSPTLLKVCFRNGGQFSNLPKLLNQCSSSPNTTIRSQTFRWKHFPIFHKNLQIDHKSLDFGLKIKTSRLSQTSDVIINDLDQFYQYLNSINFFEGNEYDALLSEFEDPKGKDYDRLKKDVGIRKFIAC